MRIVVGCVAENCPKYLDQALRLLQSWRWFAGELSDSEFHVCVVDDVSSEYRKRYENYGAQVDIVPRFSKAHPQSNKLRFLELPIFSDANRIILLDCDIVVVQEPLELISETDFVGKIADLPTVTAEIFQSLFSLYELPLPEANQRCSVRGHPIIPYFNAGVLSFSYKSMSSLVPEWIRINRNLAEEHLDILENCSNFCEQASLSLALVSSGTSFETLTNKFNFPVHCQNEPLDSNLGKTDPAILHYHWLVEDQGLLLPSPYPMTNFRIESFNNRIRQERKV